MWRGGGQGREEHRRHLTFTVSSLVGHFFVSSSPSLLDNHLGEEGEGLVLVCLVCCEVVDCQGHGGCLLSRSTSRF